MFKFLDRVFEAGPAIKSGEADLVMTQQEIGDLYIPSGRVLACDPIHMYDLDPYAREIAPGRYPVILGLAEERARGAGRVVYSMIRLRDEEPVEWDLAKKVRPHFDGGEGVEIHSFGVDVGLGSYMDPGAGRLLRQRMNADDTYHNHIYEAVEDKKPEWANIIIDQTTGLNIVVFETGSGDGGYFSYWGCNASGHIVCLVTDFGLAIEAEG